MHIAGVSFHPFRNFAEAGIAPLDFLPHLESATKYHRDLIDPPLGP